MKAKIYEIDEQIKKLEELKKSILEQEKRDGAIERYKKTYHGKQLFELHSLSETGLWKVSGEDPNPDLGGSHHNPLLGYFRGTLKRVIEEAHTLNGFYTWGGGGKIEKVSEDLIIDLT